MNDYHFERSNNMSLLISHIWYDYAIAKYYKTYVQYSWLLILTC